ncbi:hypothetical protein L2747_09465 [Shewanella marinintestina]|uniref:hypothetical protein n=1 Tax=Shewanella marinintestina TaxID=190305 RepID=UPI00200C0A67|nr:hypothetical protein [Shewanella marinintestina]MCL1146222.1 hypothetical protein [Shewanella marinintestina]
MITKNVITAMLLIGTLAGCVANDYGKMSRGSGVSETLLVENCESIICSYDKLKDRVQATANDMNGFLAISGAETRTIQYTWVSDTNNISINLYSTALYGSWSFIDSAEVYVGKDMIAKVSGSVDRIVGYYNEVAGEHEKVEILTGIIDVEAAQKIAEANYENVTVRFYGKDGYKDKELPREHDLIKVVNLAKSA